MKKKALLATACALVFVFGINPVANAMHIMEGFLPVKYCIAWGVICIPFIAVGMKNLKNITTHNRKAMIILAMAGAYAFVLSALKIPSVTGSSSHPTGTGLAAILFGPTVASIISLIVLLFQAILLAHGGLTTLGANTFSMGIAGPLVSYAIYRGAKKAKMNNHVAIFLAASLGDLFTYVVTSVQLAVAYPAPVGGVAASFGKFAAVFAVTQIPLAVIEGLLTVVIVMGLDSLAREELNSLETYRRA
ncbi:MAG: energy-coupling factor ABC transporter permease [Peptoniphilus sp.]|nr:energy-coupling factor ABC transporter permease [Peptoniphilus sp.]MDD7363660.1 energy-coupling factor ABC transporter permease [Bacillota bacterium]MDY6044694.1 energy-coupling factor ABC transporter permease [Peptoniphilus sp.]